MEKNTNRNRDIVAAFEAGIAVEQLSGDYCLTQARIRAILVDERNRRAVSPDPFYRVLRASSSSSQASR